MGGMDRHGIIATGSPAQVESGIREFVKTAPKPFMLGADCTVEASTDWSRLKRVQAYAEPPRRAGRIPIKRQHIKRIDQPPYGLTTLAFVRAAEKLERRHSGGLKPFGFDVLRKLVRHWLSAGQEVDQNVRVGNNHRQLSRRSVAIRHIYLTCTCMFEPAA